MLWLPVLDGHAPPIVTPKAPYRVRGVSLLDAESNRFLLNGVQLQLDGAAAKREMFRILRQRWNLNAVRLTVEPEQWLADGAAYLDKVRAAVRVANEEGLVAILAAAGGETGLPGSLHASFWAAAGAGLKDHLMVVFSLYAKPSAEQIPGFVAGVRRAEDWAFWRNGGTAADGTHVVGMQELVTTIRAAGAAQIIAVPGFRDRMGWAGFGSEQEITGENLIYEAYAYFDQGLTDEARDAGFGFLTARYPVYVGEWGVPLGVDAPACHAAPGSADGVSEALQQLLLYFLVKQVSWTAAEFRVGDLITDLENAEASELVDGWTCAALDGPTRGIGRLLLLWLTGDTHGFGSIAADQMASAAGGPPGPLSPGQMLSIYGQGLGPDVDVQGVPDVATGRLATELAETVAWFDGIASPVFSAGSFLVKVQVPYEVAGRETVNVQASYRGVRSNVLRLRVAEASPEIFVRFGTVNEASAFDAAGRGNSQANGFAAGDLVVLFATGLGEISPAGVTGLAAGAPLGKPVLPVSVSVGGLNAAVEYLSMAPGLIGVAQMHVRMPAVAGNGARLVPVAMTAGAVRSRGDVRVWMR